MGFQFVLFQLHIRFIQFKIPIEVFHSIQTFFIRMKSLFERNEKLMQQPLVTHVVFDMCRCCCDCGASI